MPAFDIRHRYQVDLPLPIEGALPYVLAMPAAPDRFVRFLFRIRGLAAEGSIEQFFQANGFTVLEHTATTYVVGLVARTGGIRMTGAEVWRTASVSMPRSIRVAADFRTEPAPRGSRLITETRVAASHPRALLAFRLYWLVVAPFSRLIRRRWLRAAAQRAGAPTSTHAAAVVDGGFR